MKKNILITSMLLVILIFSSVAFGESSPSIDPEILLMIQADVDQTNALIDTKINEALIKADIIIAEYERNVSLAVNELSGKGLKDRLKSLFNNKEVEINNLINNLINDTNIIAEDMFERAAEKGVLVICELIPVEIDGRIVMIDPIRVIGS